jgi:hypothetical protein
MKFSRPVLAHLCPKGCRADRISYAMVMAVTQVPSLFDDFHQPERLFTVDCDDDGITDDVAETIYELN